MQIQLEVTNVCDSACVFCPYPVMQRAKGTMAWALFTKIIDEVATIPVIDHITLTGLGETLLDRYLVKRIAYVRSRMAAVPLDLVTNGHLLTEKLIDTFISTGLTTLSVSLNAVTAEKRKAIMGVDKFDHVVAMCRYALKAGAGKMRTIVKGVLSPDLMEQADHEAFVESWGGRVDQGGNGFVHLEGNWAGTMRPMRMVPTSACHRALGQIMVLQDGRVSLCCFDAEGAVILGDLNTQTVREVFAGDKALGIRQAHQDGRRRELPLCATCTAI